MSRSEIEHLPPSVQLAWLSTASAATYNQGPSPLTCECPFARADRCDGSGLGDEPAPGVAGGLDDLLVGVEDALESQVWRRYCQMFSTGFSSGARDGSRMMVMFLGMLRAPVVCQPARSSSSAAWAPRLTVRAISSRWSCMACVSAKGSARAAPMPRAGQMAPNRYALS